ncbi:nuclear transport factor 2 family protein [Tateyamaria omphalii]|uniref:SnoaL-like domain-containing protein n=1 Tax=Tateyamaria omphalii TaxID=299262 RepID=A0A1P8MZH6_9RHOB|nr:nuclear transport factor 2 family protein [Tateyamaria omphalii]APX13392.1 hypothetical protein BWR18_18160 [Tateyamaria omphalii]
MRNFIPAIALLGATTGMALADTDTTIETTTAFFQALEQGDLDAVAALMADDVVNTLPYAASGATTPDAFRIYSGKAEVIAYFEGASQFIPTVSFIDAKVTVSGDGETVFVENRGDMILADGRPYSNLYVWRLDFEDGQIVEMTEYFNPVTAAIAFNRPIGPEQTSN